MCIVFLVSCDKENDNGEIVLRHYEFQDNAEPPANESYFWEYLKDGDEVLFYDSRTETTVSRDLSFDEFSEFAKSQVPLRLFPNPNKLYDDSTYYIDEDGDGNVVFTLYSSDGDGYSLRQVVFTDTEMIYRTKSYTKGEGYEDTTINVYRVYNEDITLPHH